MSLLSLLLFKSTSQTNQHKTGPGNNKPCGGQEPADDTPVLQEGRLAALFKSDVIPTVVSKLDC